ncbi:hypothetical protein ACT7DF_21790 [Bacillus cereus]
MLVIAVTLEQLVVIRIVFSNGRGREKSSSFSAVRAALTSSRLRAADERIV